MIDYEDDYDDEYGEPAEDWTEGTCDRCSGPPTESREGRATMASAIVPVCACFMGQGATPEDCVCGPEQTS